MLLEIQSLPSYNWHISLANLLPKPVWDKLRREIYARAKYQCEICGAVDVELHCHEVWVYDDKKKLQKLHHMEAICKDCHNIRHWWRTVQEVHDKKLPASYLEKLRQHFCTVNECTPMDFEVHKVKVGNKTQEINKTRYKVDFGKFTPERVVKEWRRIQRD